MKLLFKYHLLIALVIASWLIIFLVLIAPFDIAQLPFRARLEIMPFYGLISFIGYIILIPVELWANQKIINQPVFKEILMIILFNILVLIGSYIYYKSPVVNGDYSLVAFTLEIYYPIFLILLPTIVFARWYVGKRLAQQNSNKIILAGDNKLDVLQIKSSDLICISSADNYVKVSYLVNGMLSTKLLRTTLKGVETQISTLVRVHRSYIINPTHFIEWKNASALLLTQMEVPISKNYKKDIMALNHSSLKKHDSPQS